MVIYLVMDLIVVACGLYVLVQYFYMIRTRKLRANMLIPKTLEIEKCKDKEGYINAVATKQLILGLASVACGLLGVIQDLTEAISDAISMICMIIFVVFCFWYGMMQKKAADKFW